MLTKSTDENEKVKPKEVFLNRNKELSKACSGEPGSRDGGIENWDSGAKCCYPIFKLEKLRQKSNRREFANDRQITCVLIGHSNVSDRHIVAATKKQDCEDYTSREHVANF